MINGEMRDDWNVKEISAERARTMPHSRGREASAS